MPRACESSLSEQRKSGSCQLLQTALHWSTGYLLVACPGIVQDD